MKYLLWVVSILWLAGNAAAENTANEILKKADQKLDIRKSELVMELKVYRNDTLRKTYRQEVKIQDWDTLVAETIYPPRNQGEKVLKTSGNMWLYLPRINKTIRVSESSSFSNSDFSNMDILNPQLGKNYAPVLLGEEKFQGEPAYKLELRAKREDVAYAKIIYWVRQKDFYPLQRDYFTFSGFLLKQLQLQTKTDVRSGDPDYFIMKSVLEKDKYTVLQYQQVKSTAVFPQETFREDTLEKR